jgi:hypothetical protein
MGARRVGQRDPGGTVGEPGGTQFLRSGPGCLQVAGIVDEDVEVPYWGGAGSGRCGGVYR